MNKTNDRKKLEGISFLLLVAKLGRILRQHCLKTRTKKLSIEVVAIVFCYSRRRVGEVIMARSAL